MAESRNSRSVTATPEGIKLLQKVKAFGKLDEGEPLTYERIAEKAKVSSRTVKRFFGGIGVDRDSALLIIEALGLQENQVLSTEEILVGETADKIRNSSKGNPDRAAELIEGLDSALRAFKEDEAICLQAMAWLKAHRKVLAQDAATTVLGEVNAYSSQTPNLDESEVEQFAQDIRKYLKLLYLCLEIGTWDLIEKAIQDSYLPVNCPIGLYVDALTFIKEQRIEQQLSSEVAQSIVIYLNYLISILPMRL